MQDLSDFKIPLKDLRERIHLDCALAPNHDFLMLRVDCDALAFNSRFRVAEHKSGSEIDSAVSGCHVVHAPGRNAALRPPLVISAASAAIHNSDKISFRR